MNPKSVLTVVLILCIVIGFASSVWTFSQYHDEFPGLGNKQPMPLTFASYLKYSTFSLGFHSLCFSMVLLRLTKGRSVIQWTGQLTKWITVSLFCLSLITILVPLALVGLVAAIKMKPEQFNLDAT